MACSLLIRSLSNLQVTRTGIRSQTSSNSGLIRPITLELFALDCWKKAIDDIVQDSPFIFYRIFMTLADNLSRHKISHLFKIWPEWTIYFGVNCLDCWKNIFDPLGMLGPKWAIVALWATCYYISTGMLRSFSHRDVSLMSIVVVFNNR